MNQDASQTIEPETTDPEPLRQESVTKAERMRSADPDEAGESLLAHLLDRARGGIRRHPFAAVGGAFAFGFVAGNGIPRFVAQTAVSMGLRALIQRVLEDAKVGIGS